MIKSKCSSVHLLNVQIKTLFKIIQNAINSLKKNKKIVSTMTQLETVTAILAQVTMIEILENAVTMIP